MDTLSQKPKHLDEIDIYNLDARIKNTLNLIKKELSPRTAETIEKYDKLLVMEARSKSYRHKSMATLLTLSRMLQKDWQETTKNDIDNLVFKIMKLYSNQRGKETYTTADCKKYLKMFFRWLKLGSRSYTEVGDPIETKGVKIQKIQDNLIREDLITEDDFTRLIHAAKNSRIKAMIAMVYEGGPRPGEALNLRIKHVRFDDLGSVIAVDGKTGARPIRLIKSVPYLLRWLEDHPLREDKEAPFFCQIEGENIGKPLSYEAARKLLLKVVADAHLSKRVNLKLFRHSEATELANFMTEAQLRKRHGWSSTSKMPSRYVHMVNADVEDALLRHYGIKKDENKIAKLPKKCSICDMINTEDSKLCSRCARPLSLETALEAEQKLAAEQEKNRIEIENMKKRLEDIEIGAEGRGIAFTRNMLRCTLEDNLGGRALSTLAYFFFEMLGNEEEKRGILKQLKKAQENGEKIDLASFVDVKKFSIANIPHSIKTT